MISPDIQRLLHQYQIDPYVKDGRLALRMNGGQIPDHVLEMLRENKAALMSWLESTQSVVHERIQPRAENAQVSQASLQQEALWAVAQLGAGGEHYTIPMRADLAGSLNASALQRCFSILSVRHHALRATFRMRGDDGLEQVIEQKPITLEFTNLEDPRAHDLEALVFRVFETPFDLRAGPLFRAHLVRQDVDRHILLLAGHHMIIDGASLGILMQEICGLYRAEVTGEPARLSPSIFQYADYTDWQRRCEASEDATHNRDYWKTAMADAPIVHALPLDATRPAEQDFKGERFSHELTRTKSRALLELAGALGTTPFALMLAAFGLLITRHANEDDLVIATPVVNRNQTAFENTVGFFANILPLRIRMDVNQPFTEQLRAVHHDLFEAFDHQGIAFDQIVDLINPSRSLGHNPLSQIMIMMDNFVAERFMMHDVRVTLGPIEDHGAKLDLSLSLRVQKESISLHWNWATAIFARETIERLNTHFDVLLDSVIAAPDTICADLDMISGKERAEIQMISTGRSEPHEDGLCHEIFAKIAAEQPDRTVIRDSHGDISYGVLNHRAEGIAQHLATISPSAGKLIGVLCHRQIEFVLAQIAILKAGHVFVPIDPACPAARLETIVATAGLEIILTADDINKTAIPATVQVLNISNPCLSPPTLCALPKRGQNDPAYVVFTSGSTGTPKGAIIHHRGMRNMTVPQVKDYEMSPDTIMTVSANVSFDSILWEIWPTLVSGGCLIMTPDTVLADPQLLSQHICDHRPTHFWLPTGLFELFCSLNLEWPDSIKTVFTGGDRLLRNCLPAQVDAKLVNIYGPTECSVWATCHEVQRDGPEPASIGRPLPNVTTYMMDARGRLLPRGTVGEICIAGDGVGLGYLGRDDLTNQTFVAVDDTSLGLDRIYRSGDLGRWREDGTIECLGRIDAQIKIRGFRVEPGEIASAIMSDTKVASAFVNVYDHRDEKRLVAFVVPVDSQDNDLADHLRSILAESMPTYMCPSQLIVLDRLPLTPNGKIDRRALADVMASSEHNHQVNTASPRDQLELELYKIWREILVNDQIGIKDSFFDVGGTSISAIKVIAAINRNLEMQFPVSELFHNPTIENLAGAIRKGPSADRTRSSLIDLKHGARSKNVVCVHPAGGTAFCYLSLARLLPETLGVFGLQAPGISEDDELSPNLTHMAQRNIRLVKHLLDRPLVLTGASFGGLMGFEMLRLLNDAGYRDVSLVMLDTEGIDDPDILSRIQPVSAEIFREKLVRYNGMYPGIDQAQIDRYHRIYNHHLLLQRDYQARPNGGHCIVLQACDDSTPQERRAGQTYWKKYTTGILAFHDSPGDHATMLESPSVDFAAAIIAKVNKAN